MHISRPVRLPTVATTLILLGGVITLAGCGGGNSDSLAALAPQDACATLAGMTIPASAIGLPTSGAVVQSTTFVKDADNGNVNGEHCQIKGLIGPQTTGAPPIEYQVNLPTGWNHKAVHYGGGAYNGTLITGLDAAKIHPSNIPRPIKLGYITLGSDSGHKSANIDWALNDEALANFGHQQLKKTHDVAVALAQRRYGQAPTRFYFIGSSQGGHEALDVAARYPADYDGVVATHPAYNVPLLHLGSLNVVQAGAANNGAGWLNPAKHTLVKNLAMTTCDELDGTVDNIISDVQSCRQVMTVAKLSATLRCPGGADTDNTCLSDAQIDAVNTIVSPYRPGYAIAGAGSFSGWGMLEGADLPLGNQAMPSLNPSNPAVDSFFSIIAATTIKYVITKDPNFNIVDFNPLAHQARTQEVGALMDVTNVDLAPFKAKGGKIIMTHGTTDQLIPFSNSEAYYKRQLAQFGQPGLDTFLHFYVIPGFAHGGGTFAARYDALTQLENWVEKGIAPQAFTTVDENAATKGRTRPMCRYGSYPRFTGPNGASLNDAANYSCVTS